MNIIKTDCESFFFNILLIYTNFCSFGHDEQS